MILTGNAPAGGGEHRDFAGLSRQSVLAFLFAMLLFAGGIRRWPASSQILCVRGRDQGRAVSAIGVVASVVSAYYYLTIIKVMYFDEPLAQLDPMRLELRTVLAVAGIFNILFFAYPGPLVSAASVAAKSLF